MSRKSLALLLASCGVAMAARDFKTTLRVQHPRLITLDSDVAALKQLVKTDEFAGVLYKRLVAQADEIEGQPPVTHDLTGKRMLRQSRTAVDRVYTLALLYRMTGEQRYAARALRELRAAAAFSDWNPAHFLDTAEMTHALAIGYDWLYDVLTSEDRKLLRDAIVEKGLDQALPIYRAHRWWTANEFNWNQVCNGGIGLGALAIADEVPAKASEVLGFALNSLPTALASYEPDGGWGEGPGYWHYATRYTAYFLSGLRTALGTTYGLEDSPGLRRAGNFRIYSVTPSGGMFNYGDAAPRAGSAAEMFWLSKTYGEPVYAWQQQEFLRHAKKAEALDLIWYTPRAKSPAEARWPLDAHFRGVEVATMRGSWSDPDAIFAGIKAGDSRGGRGHAHYDLGSFFLEYGGVRFATDLGPDSYFDGYFGATRPKFYRTRTEAHNTIVIDGENQDLDGVSRIVRQNLSGNSPWIVVDLKEAWRRKSVRYERGIAMIDRRHLIVQDEIELHQPGEIVWGLVSEAEVDASGRRAVLTKEKWAAVATIVAPVDARFETRSTAAPPPQNQNEGTTKLIAVLPAKVERARVVVSITPCRRGDRPPALNWKDLPLTEWK